MKPYQIWNEDCIRGMQERVEPESVDLIVTSIPFEELFTYSGKLEDVGNNGSTVDVRAGRFALNMRFVIEGMLRVLRPGCNACIHIQQLLAYKNQHGFMGRRDFRGAIIDLFRAGGFDYVGEAAIVKDPQAMAQRLSLHSLQFKTGYARNGCKLAPAPNDFLIVFAKPGEHPCPPKPILYKSNPGGWITSDDWVKWAHGCWTDIDEFDILDGARYAREHNQEKHVCPLQLEVIRRCVLLYTSPARLQPDVRVLDPFMGIGSTAWVCQGGKTSGGKTIEPRGVIGFELKESYYATAVKNAAKASAARQKDEAGELFREAVPA